jgi:hypothetical protein
VCTYSIALHHLEDASMPSLAAVATAEVTSTEAAAAGATTAGAAAAGAVGAAAAAEVAEVTGQASFVSSADATAWKHTVSHTMSLQV